MSTDKFGRFRNNVQVKSAVERIYRKRPLPLTAEGDIDAGGKRIRFTADPINDEDCVNKRFMFKIIKNTDEKWKSRLEEQKKAFRVNLNDLEADIKQNSNKIMDGNANLEKNVNQLKSLETDLNNMVKNTDQKIKVTLNNIDGKMRLLKIDLQREIKNCATSLTHSITRHKQLAVDQAKADIKPEYMAYCDKNIMNLENNLNTQLNKLHPILKEIQTKVESIKADTNLDVDHIM